MSTAGKPRLLDEVRQVLRVRRYSIHTEPTYCDWIRRYVRCHGMTCRAVFPAASRATDTRSGVTRRHHVAPRVINKAIKAAVRNAGLPKRISAHTFRR